MLHSCHAYPITLISVVNSPTPTLDGVGSITGQLATRLLADKLYSIGWCGRPIRLSPVRLERLAQDGFRIEGEPLVNHIAGPAHRG